jgi:hypothetical protein
MGQRKCRYVGRAIAATGWRIRADKLQRGVNDPFLQALLNESQRREEGPVAFAPRQEVAANKTAGWASSVDHSADGSYPMNMRRSVRQET